MLLGGEMGGFKHGAGGCGGSPGLEGVSAAVGVGAGVAVIVGAAHVGGGVASSPLSSGRTSAMLTPMLRTWVDLGLASGGLWGCMPMPMTCGLGQLGRV